MRPTPSIHPRGAALPLQGAPNLVRSRLEASSLARIGLLLSVALLVTFSLRQLATPAVVPAVAPANVFSAERAMRDLQMIAGAPRPVGSAGHAAARQYILDQLTAQGLHPELQTTTALNRFPGSGAFTTGQVTNVVVRVPGT